MKRNNFFSDRFSSVVSYKRKEIIRTPRAKAFLVVKSMPEESKIRTDVDFNEYKVSDEQLIEELVSNKKRLSSLYRYLGKYDYEYNNYFASLNMKSKSDESFYERYKDEKYKGKTIKEYLNDFKNKKISQDEMNHILSEFKKSNEKYRKSGSS